MCVMARVDDGGEGGFYVMHTDLGVSLFNLGVNVESFVAQREALLGFDAHAGGNSKLQQPRF